MTNANSHLCEDVPIGYLMTLIHAVVDRPRCRVRLVSAGHDPILEYSPRAGVFRELAGSDVPLGMEPTWGFTGHT
jgi:serine phosphatase RsbU (regulator of sigma subunit)